MCPPSSLKLIKEMFVGHAVGKGKIHGGGDKEIQRRTLRLYWPASRYASLFSTCFFFPFCSFKIYILFPAAIFLQAGGDKAAFELARLQVYNF